jgi:hypothetical protein
LWQPGPAARGPKPYGCEVPDHAKGTPHPSRPHVGPVGPAEDRVLPALGRQVEDLGQPELLLQRLLANLGQPFLALRIGVDAEHDEPPPTPRPPAEQAIEIVS